MAKEIVQITVDIHEENSGILEEIQSRGLEAIQEHMETSDVRLSYRGKTVGLEIKRKSDYMNSLKDRRLKDQICRLHNNFDWQVLIVECAEPYIHDDDDGYTIEEKLRKYKMSLRTLNRRLTVYETSDQNETVNIIEEIARDLKANKLFVMRRPVIIDAEMSGPMKFICGLPHVKHTIGERILDRYGCAKHALDDVDKWIDIDGIGKVKLAKIKDTLMEGEYK